LPSWIETVRGTVRADECDQLGHMNVVYYTARISDAYTQMLARIGMTAAFIASRRLAFAAVRQEVDNLREVRAGDLIVVRSRFVGLGPKGATVQHEMRNAETGEVAMRARIGCVNFDLERRRAAPIAAEIAARIQDILVTEPDADGGDVA